MKLTAALTLAVALTLSALPAAADPVPGDWILRGGTAKVRIAACSSDRSKLCGTIVWAKDAILADGKVAKDARNPDPALRNRPIIGLVLIQDLKPAGTGKWVGGKIYDPDSGKTYASKLQINPDGTLKVEGCISVVCQAQTWRKG